MHSAFNKLSTAPRWVDAIVTNPSTDRPIPLDATGAPGLHAGPVTLLRRARLLDGTGEASTIGDLRVTGDRIEAVAADLAPLPDEPVVDATGLALCPGFVDLHSHSDLWSVVPGPDGVPIGDVPKLLQGCTTQVFGQDGISAAPVAPDDDDFRGFQAGLNGRLPAEHWTWRTMGEYLAAVGARCATRSVSLVGHATVRRAVMGMADREPTAAEIGLMQEALAEAFAAGARGFSTGLVYVPAAYATEAEVHALCEVVAHHDLPFFVHVRSESDLVIEASEESCGPPRPPAATCTTATSSAPGGPTGTRPPP